VFEIISGGAVWNRTDGELKVRAVSIAPSRRGPHYYSGGSSAPYIDGTAAVMNGGDTISFSESVTSEGVSTSISSGVSSSGLFWGKVVKWIGQKSLDTVEFAIIKRRTSSHISCLKKWRKHPPALGVDEREKVFRMLDDALEMSR
jgi:hypothetical protein